MDADLIIVGAGSAGLPCAVAAAEAGAKVLLVDKAEEIGGTLHVSGGHLSAAGAQRQVERGIEDSPQQHLEDIQRISRGTAREDLVSQVVEHAASVVDWLQEGGFDFAPECPRLVYGHEPYSVARTYYGRDEARSILQVLRRYLEPHLRAGQVELRLQARVSALLEEHRRVVGVELLGPEGEAETLRAPAVVLATGGYGASEELVRELDGRPLFSATALSSTGDGLRLAGAAGAAIRGRRKSLPTFGGLPQPGQPGRVRWQDRPLLVASERAPWEIYVDSAGRRFVAEDEPSMHAKEELLASLEDLTFYMVFDDRAVDGSQPLVVGWSPEELRQQAGQREGTFVASSLEELAEASAIDPEGLRDTVRRYNHAVEQGLDGDFGRRHLPAQIAQPPFYALRNHGITLITFAGVDVDEQLQVRREDGSVIAGLYALGELLGAAATTGQAFCGGMMLTPALVFGRLLGQRLGMEASARKSA